MKIESCHTTKGLCETNEYTVTFQDEGEISPLHPLLIQNGTEFGCDIDGNGEIDFYIQFLQSDSSEFLYLNANKEPLQECEIKKEGTMNQWDLSVVKMFDNPSITQNTRGEGWGGCFSRRMGSPTGIIMGAAASFIGPEGYAAVAVGAALSCLIWTPY
ncbi:MAG: hypothetical protein K2K64_10765 [Muribaculaceae bacterium]|nr:hypothetical protein [Muribaculaceae bacterium]